MGFRRMGLVHGSSPFPAHRALGPLASILRNTFFPGTKTRRWEKTAVFDKAMVRLYYMEYTGKNQHGGRGYFPFAFFPQDIYFL